MSRHMRSPFVRFAFVSALLVAVAPGSRPAAQTRPAPSKQKIDEAYTAYLANQRRKRRALAAARGARDQDEAA